MLQQTHYPIAAAGSVPAARDSKTFNTDRTLFYAGPLSLCSGIKKPGMHPRLFMYRTIESSRSEFHYHAG
jgi:hypothetical protein